MQYLFISLISYVENCAIAGLKAHTPRNAVSISESPEHRSRLIHGIGQKVLGLSEGGIICESEDRQRIATILHTLDADPYSTAQSR